MNGVAHDDWEQGYDPARGCLIAVGMGTLMWAIAIGLVYWLWNG